MHSILGFIANFIEPIANFGVPILEFLIFMVGVLIPIAALATPIVAGLAVYYLSQRTKASEKQTDILIEQTKISQQQTKISQKSLEDERYNKAIENLGSNKESVLLGAIFGLYHSAKESEERRKEICFLLCARVRGLTREDDYKKSIIKNHLM